MQQPPFVIFQRDPNGTVTQSIAQGIATLGQAWANASKQYWANMRLPGSPSLLFSPPFFGCGTPCNKE